MKNLTSIIVSLVLSGIFFFGCQENNIVNPLQDMTVEKAASRYNIELLGGGPVNNGNGTYTWTWSITNVSPWEYKTDSYQNLNHWAFQPGECLVNADIVSAVYITDDNATAVQNPFIGNDPSIDACYKGDVFKFDFGTNGSNISYYQLVINKNYSVDRNAIAYWKAGDNCGQIIFDGIGCYNETECTNYPAWADGLPYNPHVNWATYIPYDGNETIVNLIAFQNLIAGTVNISEINNDQVTITINLNAGWSLQDVNESVKIQGYEDAPTGNPAPGQFTTYKGEELFVTVDVFNFYGIHLDVQYCGEQFEVKSIY